MIFLLKNPYWNLFNKSFFIYFAIIFLHYITHAAAWPTEKNKLLKEEAPSKEVINECSSDICKEEASFFLNNINQEIDPCDDFYEFACGNYIKSATIPEDDNKVSILSTIQKNLKTETLNDFKEIKEDDVVAFKKVKQFYHNCVKNPGEEDKKTLLDIINNAGGMPVLSHENKWDETKFDWLTAVSKIKMNGFQIQFPTVMSIQPRNNKNILVMYNPSTKVDETFFSNESKSKQAYLDYMVELVVMLGADRNVAEKEMQASIDFEMKLYKIESPVDESIEKRMTIKELAQKNPTIHWLDFIRNIYEPSDITIDEEVEVIVNDLSAIDKLEQLIASTPKKVIANFIFGQIIFESADYLPLDFLGEGDDDRTAMCEKTAVATFPVAMSALYVRKHRTGDYKKNSMEIVRNIQEQVKKNIQEAEWLDNDTRKAALEKLQAMDMFVGIYDEYFDDSKLNEYYQGVEISDGPYLRTSLNVSIFYNKITDSPLKNQKNSKEWFWHESASTLNAFYVQASNHFELTAALLQQPFFHTERPRYLNYGNLGWTIGHEIIHGFDTEGRTMDKDGKSVDWWTDATEQKYLQKVNCFINQYSNYTVEEVDLQLNAKVTHVEDIADNAGIKAAYDAYVEWTKTNNIEEPRLPGLDYSPRQLFWISAASSYCGKFSAKYLKKHIRENEHSPAEARVKLPLRNSAKFAEDFRCKSGSKMNPVEKCDLW